jgi:glycosyltransferase involved in cell wall biosynthesis/peptidoglycan/xylan/chitin deacetylase (PgdA/CDA1 family)
MDASLPGLRRLAVAGQLRREVRFSVVIPTYERRQIVQRAVLALAGQELADFEVIVVDDGSSDGSADVLQALTTPFPLRVVRQGNQGAAEARNAGAAAALGDILLFLDDDMIADPRMLVEHNRAHVLGADLVIGHVPLHGDSPKNLLTDGVQNWARSRAQRLISTADDIPIGDLLTGQMSISRCHFAQLGGFDAGITRNGRFGGEDIDFGYRVKQAGYRAVFSPDAISYQYYNVDPDVFLRRTYESARAHQELAFKHPEQADELYGSLRFGSRARWMFAPLLLAPRAWSRPLRSAVGALVRRRRAGPRLRKAFLMMRILEHTRGLRDARRALGTGQVTVLAYHAIADLRADPILKPYGVPPALLAAHLDGLRNRGWVFVDLDAVIQALEGKRRLPRRAVLMTFDDCYEDLLSAGAPVLGQRGIRAVGFAVSELVGASNRWDLAIGAEERPLLDAGGLHQLEAKGIEIGAHGMRHRPLTEVSAAELEDELNRSLAGLEAIGLRRPRVFSYPYGDFNATVASAARRAGYVAAFTTEHGAVRRHSERMALPRVEVRADDRPWHVVLLVATAGWPETIRSRLLRYLRIRR